MARTRKAIQPLNLAKYDVLIEDRGPRSDYFKITQFDGYFSGGRNAFLIAGAGVLRPGSEILVEILNKDGNTVYSAPVKNFSEGNSRLIQVEVYEDTPIGVGKIVVLGSTDVYIDGKPIPENWISKYNVRWVSDVTISPLKENKTPIRFLQEPSILVQEKFYAPPKSSSYQQIDTFLDLEFSPLYTNVYQTGYQIKLRGPGVPGVDSKFTDDMVGGRWLGLLSFPQSQSNANIPWNPEARVLTIFDEDGVAGIPITRIINSTTAESNGGLFRTRSTDKTLITAGFFSGSSAGTHYPRIEPFGLVTASNSMFAIQYFKVQEALTSASAESFASIRIVNLDTISGEIHKVRLSYKGTSEPGNYILLGDVTTSVAELLTIDTGSRIKNTGTFKDLVLTDYWYAATMSVARTDTTINLPITSSFYITSSVATTIPFINIGRTQVPSAIDATPPISSSLGYNNLVSYFIGTKENNTIRLFPTNEYTLSFDAFVTKTSGSFTGSATPSFTDYSLQIFLVPVSGSYDKVISTDARGQLIGTLTPNANFSKQNFETVEFNFVPAIDPRTISNLEEESGIYGLRFIVYGGFWNIANVSVKIAQEPFFSPDEVNFVIPNTIFTNKLLTFKADYLDINNNSVNVSTLSTPVYFTGSEAPGVFPYSGSAVITGSLYVSGSGPYTLAVSGSSTFNGLTSVHGMFEKATIVPSAPPSEIDYYVKSQVVLFYTGNTNTNWTLNILADATTPLNDIMAVGQNMTLVMIVVNGASGHYQADFSIDYFPQTVRWQGSAPPTGGTPNSADIYAYSIFKTGNYQYSVFASKVAFAS